MEKEKEEKEVLETDEVSNTNEEVKQEVAPVEETPTEEAPVVNEEENASQNFNYEGSLQDVEKNRKEFLSTYKGNSTLKIIIAVVSLALIIFCWVGIPNILKVDNVMTYAIVAVVIILVLVVTFMFVSKRMMNKKMREYFRKFYVATNAYSFDQDGFDKHELQTPDKLSLDDFVQCDMYKNIIEVGSRGLTSFEYKDIPLMVSDAAGNVKGTQRMLPVFVGKYIYGRSNYDNELPIIIYIKGSEKPLPPTNIDDKRIVEDNDKMVIYTNNEKWEKTVTPSFRKILKKIKLTKNLVDVAISIKQGQVFICLGYDDPLMVLPLDKPFNPHPYEEYKGHLKIACELIEELNK